MKRKLALILFAIPFLSSCPGLSLSGKYDNPPIPQQSQEQTLPEQK